ncbi:hypothetical protein ACROYT_G014551 [Oculina patagonica]
MSNAVVERGANSVKRVMTRLRNCLKNDMLSRCLHVSINGPEPKSNECQVILAEAAQVWRNTHKRNLPPPSLPKIGGRMHRDVRITELATVADLVLGLLMVTPNMNFMIDFAFHKPQQHHHLGLFFPEQDQVCRQKKNFIERFAKANCNLEAVVEDQIDLDEQHEACSLSTTLHYSFDFAQQDQSDHHKIGRSIGNICQSYTLALEENLDRRLPKIGGRMHRDVRITELATVADLVLGLLRLTLNMNFMIDFAFHKLQQHHHLGLFFPEQDQLVRLSSSLHIHAAATSTYTGLEAEVPNDDHYLCKSTKNRKNPTGISCEQYARDLLLEEITKREKNVKKQRECLAKEGAEKVKTRNEKGGTEMGKKD